MSTTPTSSARTADRTVSAHNLSSRKFTGKAPGSTDSSPNTANRGTLGDSGELELAAINDNQHSLSPEMTTGQPTQDFVASASRGSSSSSSSKKLHHHHHHQAPNSNNNSNSKASQDHSTGNEVISIEETDEEEHTNHDDESHNTDNDNKDSRRTGSRHARTTRPTKYKDTDVKRMESSRRRSRSRSQDRSRRSAESQGPSRQRRSKSRDAKETKHQRRSRSQDPLATAQQRLEERRRSKSQEHRDEENKAGEEAANRPVRQGRRPSRPSKGTSDSTSSRNVTVTTTTTPPATVSPVPAATSTVVPDPILQQYLGEGTRAFDYILGLEPATNTTTEIPNVPGAKSTKRTQPGTGTPMTPQLSKKSFEPTNNPHVSPPIFFNSMAKKVAGDRWLQDESIRSRRSSDPIGSPRKSLGDQLMALGSDSFNANTLDPDEKSMHSQDMTPQVPRRRGSKRLAGTRPKPLEPPLTVSSQSNTDMMSHDGSSTGNNNHSTTSTLSNTKSPHKQIRKLATRVVKSSKSMLQGESTSNNNNNKAPPPSATGRNAFAPSHQPLCDKGTDSAAFENPLVDSKSSSSSWLLHDDGALTPRTMKRRSTLQKARDKVTTLLKTKKKSSQMPDVWGALEDSDSVEISEVEDEQEDNQNAASPLNPFSATSPQFDVKISPKGGNHFRDTTPSPPPPPSESPSPIQDYSAPTPSRRVKSKAASAEAGEHEIIPSDPEKQPVRKSAIRKPRRSSSPSRRTRSSSPSSKSNPNSSSTTPTTRRKSRSIQEKQDSNSHTNGTSRSQRSQSLSNHGESVGTAVGSGGEERTTSHEQRRRSRSESRPEAHAVTTKDESRGGVDSRRSKNHTRPSSSREVSRSNSPHALRSTTITMKERRPRPTSNSPGTFRREGTKRREALQKIRSERSVKTLNLAETTTTNSETTEPTATIKAGPTNDYGAVKVSRRQIASTRSVTSGDGRVSSVRSMDPNILRDYHDRNVANSATQKASMGK